MGNEKEISPGKVAMDFVQDLELQKVEDLIRQGATFSGDEALLGALLEFLMTPWETQESGAEKDEELLERFYYQLLRCYRTGDDHLIRFVMQFVLALIWRHLNDLTKSRASGATPKPALNVLLCALYNMMILDNEGHLKTQSYAMPVLTNCSIYHDPAEFTSHILKLPKTTGSPGRITVKNSGPIQRLTRGNKWTIFRALMRRVAEDLVFYSKPCQRSMLRAGELLFGRWEEGNSVTSEPAGSAEEECIPIEVAEPERESRRESLLKNLDMFNALKGFSLKKDRLKKPPPRIILHVDFLMDFLDILYILMYQGFRDEVLSLVGKIFSEGEYRAQPGVVLLATAIKHRGEADIAEQVEKKAKNYICMVPSINTLGPEEVRANLTTNSSIRWRRVAAVKTPLESTETNDTLKEVKSDVALDEEQELHTEQLDFEKREETASGRTTGVVEGQIRSSARTAETEFKSDRAVFHSFPTDEEEVTPDLTGEPNGIPMDVLGKPVPVL